MNDTYFKKYTKNIEAFIQILPNTNFCWEDVKIADDKRTLYVRCLQDFGKGKVNVVPNYWTFKTDGVLYNLNQNEMYKTVISDALNRSVMGINLLIFAYGQTGTGKSTTTHGLKNIYENRGMSSRILTDLFKLKKHHGKDSTLKYYVSFIEVNKTGVLDLLQKEPKIKLHNPYKGLQKFKIKSEYEGLKYLFQGEENRNIFYNTSYFSHYYTSVFTIYVKNCSRLVSKPVNLLSKIHIIDMAGIDTTGNLSCQGKNSIEIGVGNLNKSQLGHYLMLLQEDLGKNTRLIKDAGILVDYLGDSLKPESMIKFVGHIRTNREDLKVTISALKFANIVRDSTAAKLTPMLEESDKLLIKNLKNQVEYLKNQNYLTAMVMNNDLASNIAQSRIEQMETAVNDYVQNKSNEISLLNISDVNAVLKIFKEKCIKLEVEQAELLKKQIPKQSTSKLGSIKGSKASVDNLQTSKDKGSKTNRTTSSLTKKRKSSSKSLSKPSLDLKSKIRSSSIKSGLSLTKLMSYSFSGNPPESLKLKAKMLKSVQSSLEAIWPETSGKNLDQEQFSEIDLRTDLGDNFEVIWKMYTTNENYRYPDMNSTLLILEENCRNLLKEYNVTIKELQKNGQKIDIKKSDLLKIQMYKEFSNLKCESEESVKIKETQQTIGTELVDLIQETIRIEEELLTLQSYLKINIDDYHRLKKNINEDFARFCLDLYKIQIPSTEQIIQCIEDAITLPEETVISKEELEENKRKELFEKFQLKLKKVQEKILKPTSNK